MIGYVTLGVDDIDRTKRFYSAFLPAVDCELMEGEEGLSYVLHEQRASQGGYRTFMSSLPSTDARLYLATGQ